ncbi:hypothetical protein Tco_0137345, partial [Tanacetum coccineum]
ALIDAVTTALPPPPLPPLPPSLSMPSPVDCRDDIPESEQPPHKRMYLSTIGSRYEVGESSTARPNGGRGIDYGFVSTTDAEERRQRIRDVGYGIRDTWVDPIEAVPEIAPMTVEEVNTRVVELAELHERDTQDLYALLGDRMTLQETVWMVEEEAYASREAWAHSLIMSFRPIVIMCTPDMQAELLALREQQRRARQPGPEARIPDHQEGSGDADSHI